jgi:hypothetical protein
MQHINTQSYQFSFVPPITGDVHPVIELARLLELNKIKEHIADVLYGHNIHKPKKKKWTMRQAVSQNVVGRALFANFNLKWSSMSDPLIPADFDQTDLFRTIILDTFNVPQDTITSIMEQINITQMFNEAIKAVRIVSKGPLKAKVTVRDSKKKLMLVTVTPKNSEPKQFKLLSATYTKLTKRSVEYVKAHGKLPSSVLSLVACMLIRYEALDTGGHQWAMPGHVKDQLKKTLNIDFEMFASAFNHHYTYYCSMFYDIEQYFMSIGPFQGVTFTRGFYMANPPYEVDALTEMVDKIISSTAEEKENPLSFVFGMPDWTKFPVLDQSLARADHIVNVQAGTVGWFDHMTGAETNYTPANYRLVIRNDAAKDNLLLINESITAWQKKKTSAQKKKTSGRDRRS